VINIAYHMIVESVIWCYYHDKEISILLVKIVLVYMRLMVLNCNSSVHCYFVLGNDVTIRGTGEKDRVNVLLLTV